MTVGFLIARALTRPTAPRKLPLTVRASTTDSVTLDVTPAHPETLVPGTWGLFLEHGGHLRLEGRPRRDGDTVTWPVAAGDPAEPGERAGWTGIVDRNPARAGLHAVDTLLPAAEGAVPTWFVDGALGDEHPVWAIHVHGLGSSRAGTLRGVVATHAAGVPSVIPAYRNTLEGPQVGRGRAELGWGEADDVAKVLDALTVTGEERFVLFGWSMGAQVVLRLAADNRYRARVAGIVLDSPSLNWANVIAANLDHAGVSGKIAPLASGWLRGRRRSRLVGLTQPLPLDRMDWVARAGEVPQPVLIHHGTGDWSAPIEDARAFASAAPEACLRETHGGHTTSWNVDPEGWHEATVAFVRAAVSSREDG